MSTFAIKLNLFLLSVILFVGCSVFLLLNHVDTIDKYIPGEAETYLHLNINSTYKLNTEKKDHLLNWLESKSTINKEGWKNLLLNVKNELGLFSMNGQIFVLAKENKDLSAYLAKENQSFTQNDKGIIIPALTLTQTSLIDQSWYKEVKNKVTFSDFVLYSKDLGKIEKTVPLLKTPDLYPIAAFGDINRDKITLDVIGNVGQSKIKLSKANIKDIPAGTKLYLRNIEAKTITSLKVPEETLELSIINLLSGPIEYLKNEEGCVIYINKTQNSLNELKASILDTVALLHPVEIERELIDGTIGIHLVADTGLSEYFAQVDNKWGTLVETEESPFQFNLTVEELENSLVITLNNPQKAEIITSNCKLPKFRKSSSLYLSTNIPEWHNVFIQNKNQTELSICID
jgi:hypothetical protein